MKSPIDYEMLKIYQIKFWAIFQQQQQQTVIEDPGRLAANRVFHEDLLKKIYVFKIQVHKIVFV